MNNNLYIDLNVLQSVPSSNINRDDNGSPKNAIYGGIPRARVSSQSWKYAMRKAFQQQTDNAIWLNSLRTARAPEAVVKAIMNHTDTKNLTEKQALALVKQAFSDIGEKFSSKEPNRTQTLLMINQEQIEKLADYLLDHADHKKFSKAEVKEMKQIIEEQNSADIALFGRMIANDKALNIDAASQVAHAISTHRVDPEYDYFSSIDDLQPKDENGAFYLDNQEYNSATLYRYANVNVKELMHNLDKKDVVMNTIKYFIKDFIMTMPTGKQNSFANKTLPQYVMVAIRSDTPVNLVPAFETPVQESDTHGYLQPSIDQLEHEYHKSEKFVDQPVATLILTTETSKLEQQVDNLSALINNTLKAVKGEINEDSND